MTMASAATKIVVFFASVKLTIGLLIILTIVSCIGIVIPQGLHAEQYLHQWGTVFGALLLAAGLDHLFSTFWFYLILFVLSCNILVCSVTRFWKNTVKSLQNSFLSSKTDVTRRRHSMTFTSPIECASACERIAKLLAHRLHFAVVSQPQGEDSFQIAARKGSLRDIGSLLFHLSLILLFLGGIIGSRFGYSTIKDLRAGEIVSVAKRDFLLRCDWFKLEQNEDHSPKDYKSGLALLSPKDSSVILEKTIEVNDPLSYKGIKIYQSSYGADPEGVISVKISITGPGLLAEGWTGDVPFNTRFPIPGTGIQAMVTNYIPDFSIDMETRAVFSRSRNPNNPAVKITLANGDSVVYSRWAFFNFPGQHAGSEPYKAHAVSYEPAFYTGLQIRQNPGSPLIWAGIILMTFGIFAVFYVPRKNVWVIIEPQGENKGTSAITIGGTSSRAYQDFQGNFEKLCGGIIATLKQEA